MKYLSVCSGIEAASCAWRGLGWQAAAFSEIEPFPCAVLKHHFPDTPNWGDMTKWKDWPDATIDLLVGGTPCQSFSTAGLRKGLDDIRGQLAIGFSAIAERYRPKWIVWENVPGVLSSGGGRDFAAFCQSLVKFGYGLCWRVLDAQHFGVPQRRRRVFVIGYLGNWRHSAAVLFEPESLRGNSKKSRGKVKRTSKNIEDGSDAQCIQCGVVWDADGPTEACLVCGAMQLYIPRISDTIQTTANDYSRADGFCMLTQMVAKSFQDANHGHGHQRMSGTQRATTEDLCPALGAKNPTAVAFHATRRDGGRILGDLSPTVEAHWGTGGGNVPNVATPIKKATGFDGYNNSITGDQSKTLDVGQDHHHVPIVMTDVPTTTEMQVRRLTPRECERLQGFPDDWTNVSRNGKPAPDGPRYKAIGNSMAVPVMRWIGQRIQMVENVANG